MWPFVVVVLDEADRADRFAGINRQKRQRNRIRRIGLAQQFGKRQRRKPLLVRPELRVDPVGDGHDMLQPFAEMCDLKIHSRGSFGADEAGAWGIFGRCEPAVISANENSQLKSSRFISTL